VPGPFVGNDLAFLYVDNRAQQIAYGPASGPLVVARSDDFDTHWEMNPAPGPAVPAITAFAAQERNYFLGQSNAPYIQSFSAAGATQAAFSDAQYPPQSLVANSEGLFAGLSSPDHSVNKVDRYDAETGALEFSRTLTWIPEYLVAIGTDYLAVAGRDVANSGKFALLDQDDLVIVDEMTLPEVVWGLDGHGDNAFVLSAAGLQTYVSSIHTMGGANFNQGYTASAYEPVSGRFFLGKNGQVEAFLNLGQDASYQGGFDEVTHIVHHHNK